MATGETFSNLSSFFESLLNMKFRHFLLSLSTFRRYQAVKRKFRRVKAEFLASQAENERKTKELTVFYEKQLAIERKKTGIALVEGTSRLYELFKLRPLTPMWINVEAEIGKDIFKSAVEQQKANADEEALDPEERAYFEDMKDSFFEYEASQGRTDAEIEKLWTNQFKKQCLEQTKGALIN